MKNDKRFAALLLVLALGLPAAACGGEAGGEDAGLTDVTLCLDWTPNTNHTGLYVAAAQGYFEEAGLNVAIVQPPEDGATASCAAGQVEFAITVQDSLAAAFSREDPLPVTAVAAILQHNTSGILSRAGEGMDSPKGLAGHTYSTWNSPIELAMMEEVVEADGGDFAQVNLIPNNIVDEAGALKENQTDAIWIYYGWGGISAQLMGVDHDYFYFKDIDPVFDYYTPVIIANNEFLAEQPEIARAFMEATARGYEFAAENPDEAADMLIAGDNTGSLAEAEELVKASQNYLSPLYIDDAEKWGVMDADRWNGFYQWLYENKLCAKDLTDKGFSNDYLPE